MAVPLVVPLVVPMAVPIARPMELWFLNLIASRHLTRSLESSIFHELYVSSYYNLPISRNVDPICPRGLAIPNKKPLLYSLIQFSVLLI